MLFNERMRYESPSRIEYSLLLRVISFPESSVNISSSSPSSTSGGGGLVLSGMRVLNAGAPRMLLIIAKFGSSSMISGPMDTSGRKSPSMTFAMSLNSFSFLRSRAITIAPTTQASRTTATNGLTHAQIVTSAGGGTGGGGAGGGGQVELSPPQTPHAS